MIAEAEARLVGARDRAAVERDAHRAEFGRRVARDGRDAGERQPTRGGRAGELVDQHGAGDPASLATLDAAAQRHVVGDDDRLDRNAFGAREFGGGFRN